MNLLKLLAKKVITSGLKFLNFFINLISSENKQHKGVRKMIISEIDLYEKLKEKLGEEEAKSLVEFLKSQAQSEVRLLAEEILQKIEAALAEIKAEEEKSIVEIKEIIQNALNEGVDKIEKTMDNRLVELQNKISKIDTVVEKLDSIDGKIGEISNKVNEINGKTGGVKGLMFFLWLLLIGTVIFDILLNIPQTRDAILKAISGGAH
jgi:DNA anti-recombination protein RmuC